MLITLLFLIFLFAVFMTVLNLAWALLLVVTLPFRLAWTWIRAFQEAQARPVPDRTNVVDFPRKVG